MRKNMACRVSPKWEGCAVHGFNLIVGFSVWRIRRDDGVALIALPARGNFAIRAEIAAGNRNDFAARGNREGMVANAAQTSDFARLREVGLDRVGNTRHRLGNGTHLGPEQRRR
jgi:hypothetical protein